MPDLEAATARMKVAHDFVVELADDLLCMDENYPVLEGLAERAAKLEPRVKLAVRVFLVGVNEVLR